MSHHANYAAAIRLKQELLQRLIRVLYHSNQIPHTLRGSLGGVAVDLFLDLPKIVCLAANNDRLALNLKGWGPITITLPDRAPETRSVLFIGSVLANAQVSLQQSSMLFRVDGLSATLSTIQITPLSGGAFSAPVQLFLNSPDFKNLLEFVLRLQLASQQQLAPPLNVSFLGDIANSNNTKLTLRVLDGVLAIGLDLDIGGVKTKGNPNLLTNTMMAGNDIEMWQNPVVLPVIMARVYSQVTNAVAQAGATLNKFSITLEDGHYHMAGAASKSGGSVVFSMNAVPHLVRPGKLVDLGEDEYGAPCLYQTPDREELWFEMRNVQVDIHRDWWVYLVEILGGLFTFGIGVEIVESIVDMARNNIIGGIQSSSHDPIASRNQYFTFANTSGPLMKLRLEQYQCHATGVFTGITLRGKFPKPLLNGDSYRFIEEVESNPPCYSVGLPFDTFAEDPQMRIRWTVRRYDTQEVVILNEGQAIGRQELSLAVIVPILLQTSRFLVECRVYRVLGATVTDFLNESRKLTITDTLDRSHPYVCWQHWVFTPIVQIEVDGSHTEAGVKLTWRKSTLHRTDFPGRCRMVSKHSLGYPSPPRDEFGHAVPQPLTPAPIIEYFDTLPFARADLMAHRAELCDYCFFGGPTKTIPLIP